MNLILVQPISPAFTVGYKKKFRLLEIKNMQNSNQTLLKEDNRIDMLNVRRNWFSHAWI